MLSIDARSRQASPALGPGSDRRRHPSRGLVWWVALLCLQADGSRAAEPEPCGALERRDERLVSVDARGDLTFASGTVAVLRDIRWPDEAALAAQARQRLAERTGTVLGISVHRKADRWGRLAVDAGQDGADLAADLVSAGVVMVDSGEADALCRHDLLAMEDEVRMAGGGLWAVALPGAGDGPGLARREGTFIVVQARIVSLAERAKRTYLNLAARGANGLSVTVSKRTWRIMLARGLTADRLRGRLVRVRGTVELWQGPMLDIADADMIEVLDGDAAPRR